MKPLWIGFLTGLLVGMALVWLAPRYLAPALPSFLRPEEPVVEGRVVAKAMKIDRLLMTIDTDEGTTLATFHQKTPEIDLLVTVGDSLTFRSEYQPFVEDPQIERVIKAAPGTLESADIPPLATEPQAEAPPEGEATPPMAATASAEMTPDEEIVVEGAVVAEEEIVADEMVLDEANAETDIDGEPEAAPPTVPDSGDPREDAADGDRT